jgi:hypothetical protein
MRANTYLVTCHVDEIFLLSLRLQRLFNPSHLDAFRPLQLRDIRHCTHDRQCFPVLVKIGGSGSQDPGRTAHTIGPCPRLLKPQRERVRPILTCGDLHVAIHTLHIVWMDYSTPVYLVLRHFRMFGDAKPLIIAVLHCEIWVEVVQSDRCELCKASKSPLGFCSHKCSVRRLFLCGNIGVATKDAGYCSVFRFDGHTGGECP